MNANSGDEATTANALLGSSDDSRMVLINGDDLGMASSANEATIACLRAGLLTSATLIVPATHAEAAADQGADLPVGVHLALNSEWDADRWRPLTGAASLSDADGWLHRTPSETCARATSADVRAEWRAQIEQAITWGIDPTHLDSHMYIAQERPDFFDIYLDLAVEYKLPVRVSGSVNQADHPFRLRARERGVACPDHLVRLRHVGSRADLMAALVNLPAGCSEFHVHPAADTPGLRQLASDWAGRVDDLRLLHDPSFWQAIRENSAVIVGYRDLRDAARKVSRRL